MVWKLYETSGWLQRWISLFFIIMIYHDVDLQFKENSSNQAYFYYEVEHQDVVDMSSKL